MGLSWEPQKSSESLGLTTVTTDVGDLMFFPDDVVLILHPISIHIPYPNVDPIQPIPGTSSHLQISTRSPWRNNGHLRSHSDTTGAEVWGVLYPRIHGLGIIGIIGIMGHTGQTFQGCRPMMPSMGAHGISKKSCHRRVLSLSNACHSLKARFDKSCYLALSQKTCEKRAVFFLGGVWLIPLLLVTCVCKWISAYLWQHYRLSSTDYSRSGKHAFSILQLRTFPVCVCVQELRNTCRDGFPTTESFLFPSSRKIRQTPGDLHLPHWRCPIYGGTPKLSTWIGFFIIDFMETPNCFSQKPNSFAAASCQPFRGRAPSGFSSKFCSGIGMVESSMATSLTRSSHWLGSGCGTSKNWMWIVVDS